GSHPRSGFEGAAIQAAPFRAGQARSGLTGEVRRPLSSGCRDLHGFGRSRRRIWLVSATNGVGGRRSSGSGGRLAFWPTQQRRRDLGYILATSPKEFEGSRACAFTREGRS